MPEIRKQARQFVGLTGRGRTPEAAIVAFLSQSPATVRAIATEVGIPIGARGRVTTEQVELAAQFV